MHYLTVQDLLWINLQTTKTVNPYDYARLEEATYYQYAYGTSTSLTRQATRFLTGFVGKQPFTVGNRATALVAFIAFVRLNEATFEVSPESVGSWLARVLDHPETIESAIHMAHDGHGHEEPSRVVIQKVLDEFSGAIAKLDLTAK